MLKSTFNFFCLATTWLPTCKITIVEECIFIGQNIIFMMHLAKLLSTLSSGTIFYHFPVWVRNVMSIPNIFIVCQTFRLKVDAS